MEEFFKSIDANVYMSIIIVVVGIVVYIVLKKLIRKLVKIEDEKRKAGKNTILNKKRKTVVKLIDNTLKYVLLIFVVVVVLQINGINVSSVIAGLGIASAIVGLALQDVIKDIISGINIMLDDYFSVGDVIRLDNGVEAKVIELGIKATRVIDVSAKDVYVIPNANITKGIVVSKQLDTNIPVPFNEPIAKVEEIVKDIINEVKQMEAVIDCEYMGIQKFGDSQMYYLMRTYCNPEIKPQTNRNVNRIVKKKLDENDIVIPFQQIDIHQK